MRRRPPQGRLRSGCQWKPVGGGARFQPLPLGSTSSRPRLALGSSTDRSLDQGSDSASPGLIVLVCQVG